MNKHLAHAAAIAVVSVLLIAALVALHDDVRSEAYFSVPNSITYQTSNGTIIVDGVEAATNPRSIQSVMELDGFSEGRVHCTLSLTFPYNGNARTCFSYWADSSSLIPVDSEPTSDGYRYVDGYTGTEMVFHTSSGIVDSVDFKGATATMKSDSSVRIEFDASVSYKAADYYLKDRVYAAGIPGAESFSVSGNENGILFVGTATVSPIEAADGKSGKTLSAVLDMNVPGSSLPEDVTSFFVVFNEGGGCVKQGHSERLSADGRTLVMIDYALKLDSAAVKYGLSLEGAADTYHLDGDFGVVSSEKIEFSYRVAV